MDNLTRDAIRAKVLGYGCHCGKYKADHPGKSMEAPMHGNKPARTKICQNCGKEFDLGERRANAKYCTEFCYNQSNTRKAFHRAREKKGVSADEIRTCPCCKKEFRLGSRHASKKYCSEECKIKSNRERVNERRKRNAETVGE